MSNVGRWLEQTFSLAGRTVVVTGAGRGLGRSMAAAARQAGASVIGVARTAAELEAAAGDVGPGGGGFIPHPFDLADTGSLDALVTRIVEAAGPIDGVVHGAAVQLRKPAEAVTPAEWEEVLRVDLTAPFLLSTAIARRQLAEGRPGSHVFVASGASVRGVAGVAPYGAAKSGLLGVVRSLAVEWAARSVRVNAIAPGYYRTQLTEPVLSSEEGRRTVVSRIPMGRVGEPSDLDGAVVLLLSDASAYVTGHTLFVDGGWSAG